MKTQMIILSILILSPLATMAATKTTAKKASSSQQQSQQQSQPQSLSSDIDSLGDDSAVVERAKALNPNNKVEIVQKRAVDRNSRLELGADYGLVGGGDSYLSTQTFGGHVDFHINPHWSVGARYTSYINNLTPEGQSVLNNAQQLHNTGNDGLQQVSTVDSPIQTALMVVDWYPVYGKLNIFSWILHFDIYTLVGFGKTETEVNGWSNTYDAGLGMGFWLTNHLALRLEGRYQTYQDRPSTLSSPRQLSTFVGQAGLGILL